MSKVAQNANCVRITIMFWTQEVPTLWILGPSKAQAVQPDLDRTSVFLNEYLGLQDFANKCPKIWLEVAFDHMRVKRCGLKWPSTSSGWSKRVQDAKCAKITTIYWTQERSPRSRTSHKCTHMNRSKCKFGAHELRFLGAKMRSGRRGIVSFTMGKLMIPWFSHDVSIEIVMQGTGAHKRGPKGPRMRIV